MERLQRVAQVLTRYGQRGLAQKVAEVSLAMKQAIEPEPGEKVDRIYYIGGGKYVVQLSDASEAAALKKAFPRSFNRGHGNSFYVTERGKQLATAWGEEHGIKWRGSPMWELKPGETPSW